MRTRLSTRRGFLGAMAAGAVSTLAHREPRAMTGPAARLEPGLAARLEALDPARIRDADVRGVLAKVPAPRIVLLQGSVPLVTMAPFGAFLAAMGYPDARLRDPARGDYSVGSFASSAVLAGQLAWHYERDGVRPLVIGHSQGGMLAVRVLHELAGAFAEAIEVVDAATGLGEGRTTIRDPLTGAERPVVGLALPYATALATGRLFRVLLGQWSMISLLPRIPDTVEEFTGFAVAGDLIGAGAQPYAATGAATVRNVTLPASYGHIGLPRAEHLAADPAARAWIDGYAPGDAAPPDDAPFDATNALHAADIWHSVKRHWCREAQRLARATA
jgi:hypothetical protein